MTTKLLLIPTQMEREAILASNQRLSDLDQVRIETCGFGLVAAAANTSRLIGQHQPSEVVLAGIAGAYDDSLCVGSAHWFETIRCHGIGVGEGESYRSAEAMGWSQNTDPAIGDALTAFTSDSNTKNTLITVSSASADRVMAIRRRGEATRAAEDMEGFAVALACRLANVPIRIVRGISNVAGERDHSAWCIQEATASVAKELDCLH